jgi:hypothetical protein
VQAVIERLLIPLTIIFAFLCFVVLLLIIDLARLDKKKKQRARSPRREEDTRDDPLLAAGRRPLGSAVITPDEAPMPDIPATSSLEEPGTPGRLGIVLTPDETDIVGISSRLASLKSELRKAPGEPYEEAQGPGKAPTGRRSDTIDDRAAEILAGDDLPAPPGVLGARPDSGAVRDAGGSQPEVAYGVVPPINAAEPPTEVRDLGSVSSPPPGAKEGQRDSGEHSARKSGEYSKPPIIKAVRLSSGEHQVMRSQPANGDSGSTTRPVRLGAGADQARKHTPVEDLASMTGPVLFGSGEFETDGAEVKSPAKPVPQTAEKGEDDQISIPQAKPFKFPSKDPDEPQEKPASRPHREGPVLDALMMVGTNICVNVPVKGAMANYRVLPGKLVTLEGAASPSDPKEILFYRPATHEGALKYVFSRSPDYTVFHIQLSGKDINPKVHAEIAVIGNKFVLVNHTPKGGSQASPLSVNDRTMTVGESSILKNGDIISISNYRWRFVLDE